MSGIFIVAAKRTPFGTFGGSLKSHTATQLGVVAANAAFAAGGVKPEQVDGIFFGNVMPTSSDGAYLARHIGMHAGVPKETPALTVNRLCGSGFQSLINGCQEIKLGESNVTLVGGAENMSQAPYAVRDVRFGTKLGVDLKMEDTLWATLTDSYCKTPMAITAENLAEQYNVSREECDEYALRSQHLLEKAQAEGRFDAEMAPVEVKSRKGPVQFAADEHGRKGAELGQFTKLAAIFKKDGTVTAGNASGICDGAGALVLANEESCGKYGYKPLARIVSYAVAGVDPHIMGIGPVPAINMALERANLKLDDMSLVEINEAFAPQYLACEKALNLNREITNTNGGAIALGHPVGASGARIMSHLTHELQRTQGKYAIGAACIGGGQGIAILIERV
eukprot:GFYU01006694.1.p1 GENE.GFYU01006694.1~~GFYU01006694.1.p1  ORF type:complete len:427 (+),score=133.05 GFYU01006694.1:101-1282(+)